MITNKLGAFFPRTKGEGLHRYIIEKKLINYSVSKMYHRPLVRLEKYRLSEEILLDRVNYY